MFSKVNSRVSKWYLAGTLTLTFCYIACHISENWPTIAAYPSRTVAFTDYLKLASCSLMTNELIILLFSLIAMFIFERLIFGCWSKAETVLFLILIMTFPPLLSGLMIRMLFSQNVMFYGCSAFIAAVTVLATQLDADRFLFGYGKYGLKSRHGFCCGFLVLSLFSLIGLVSWINVVLFSNGFLFSWFYLRFLQHHAQRKYGDHRPGFAFAKFFPGPMEGWVAGPTNMIYQLLLRTRLFPSLERKSEIVSTASFAMNIPGLTTESDRHRRIALNALNDRLFKTLSPKTGGSDNASESVGIEWPSIEETIDAAGPSEPVPEGTTAQSPANPPAATLAAPDAVIIPIDGGSRPAAGEPGKQPPPHDQLS